MKIIDLVASEIPTVGLNDRLTTLSDTFLKANIVCVPVLDDEGKIFGVLTSSSFAESHANEETQLSEFAWEVCVRDFQSTHPDTAVKDAVALIKESEQTFLVVTEGERYIGIVTTDSLFDMIHVGDERTKSASAVIDPKTESNELA